MDDFQHTGFIYVVETKCIPGWVKIGFSIDVKRRISELNTAVPIPFKAIGIWDVEDYKVAETVIHQALILYRSKSGSEHFELRTDVEHLSYEYEDGLFIADTRYYSQELRDFIESVMYENGFKFYFAHGYFDYL